MAAVVEVPALDADGIARVARNQVVADSLRPGSRFIVLLTEDADTYLERILLWQICDPASFVTLTAAGAMMDEELHSVARIFDVTGVAAYPEEAIHIEQFTDALDDARVTREVCAGRAEARRIRVVSAVVAPASAAPTKLFTWDKEEVDIPLESFLDGVRRRLNGRSSEHAARRAFAAKAKAKAAAVPVDVDAPVLPVDHGVIVTIAEVAGHSWRISAPEIVGTPYKFGDVLRPGPKDVCGGTYGLAHVGVDRVVPIELVADGSEDVWMSDRLAAWGNLTRAHSPDVPAPGSGKGRGDVVEVPAEDDDDEGYDVCFACEQKCKWKGSYPPADARILWLDQDVHERRFKEFKHAIAESYPCAYDDHPILEKDESDVSALEWCIMVYHIAGDPIKRLSLFLDEKKINRTDRVAHELSVLCHASSTPPLTIKSISAALLASRRQSAASRPSLMHTPTLTMFHSRTPAFSLPRAPQATPLLLPCGDTLLVW